jgi:hypothetical protein
MTTRHLSEAREIPATQAGPLTERDGTGWVRAAAVGGLAFFGLFIAFASLTSNTPAATDTRQEVFDYLVQHHDRLQLAAALYGLAMPAALLFLSGLFAALRSAEGGRPRMATAAQSGGILAAAATVTGALVLGTTATRFLDLGPAGTRVFWTMFLLSIGATLTGEALMIGSTGVIGLRSGTFSRWFVISSVVLALASCVGVFTIGYTGAGIQAVAGVTAVLNAVWILLASLSLWRRPEMAGDPAYRRAGEGR